MTPIELLAVVVGLVVGYVVVTRVLYKGDDTPQRAQKPGADEPRRQAPRDDQKPEPEKYQPFGPRWATVLGVQPDATRDEITAAYKRKISEYHPDKTTRLGPEIQVLAETRSKEINAAYDEAMRRFR